jgi:outer membrane protein TolC
MLLFGMPAAAAPAPPTVRLTLRDAVQLALQQNPQVQIANLNLAQREEDRKISRSGLLPQVALGAYEQVRRVNIQAQIGIPFPGFPQHVGPYEVFQAGPGFSAPIFDLTLWRRWQASQSNVTATAARRADGSRTDPALVVSQYLGGLPLPLM